VGLNTTTRKKRLLTLTGLLWACLGAQCLAQELPKDPSKQEWRDLIGTNLSGSNCKPTDNSEDQGARICKGVEGYSFLLKGDRVKPEIFLIAPNGRQHQVPYWDTSDSKYQGLHSSVLWTVVHRPRKTIAVTFTADVAPRQDYSEWGSYEIIVRVSPGPVCVVGSIAAGPSSVADSVGIASSPHGRRCLNLNQREKVDWFAAARRLANEGQIEAAKLALTKVHEPSKRFLIYREISGAQLKAGDSKAARRTLLAARDEALKTKTPDGLRFTLGYVVEGMAEAGLYDSAKLEIKRFPEPDRLQLYFEVARIQGEKGDLEAAKRTFAEAIQIELKRNPRIDFNLSEIGVRQARIGLVDEARKTASMIHDPQLRERVESIIKERPSGP